MVKAVSTKPKEQPIKGRYSLWRQRRLRATVRDLFAEQYADAMDLLDRAAGRKAVHGELEPDWRLMFTPEKLKAWSDDVYPDIAEAADFGGTLALNDLHRKLGRIDEDRGLSVWEVESPNARQAVKRAAFALSTTANDVTAKQMSMLTIRFRAEIMQGIETGETYDWMAKQIKELFGHADKYRSQRIAQTETQRAIHVGLLEQYKESGVVEGVKWMLSGSPCEQCVAVADANPDGVPVGSSFARVAGNPIYSDITAPPLHPNCACSLEPILIPVDQMPRRAA